ncbi:hypothetical protein SCUCBS95973_001719 [Sporothrix curviconia]|uniref:beta-galactosidase n=1 Tax=Sporothrix curviconia TaxID=1260050 RepID=A0ABP0B103_9PEZI
MLLSVVWSLLALLGSVQALPSIVNDNATPATPATPAIPAMATGLVSWDQYSLRINGTRVFLQAGEFHYQRLPVPSLWPDIFQKMKANGFNAVSIYFFWSYHSAAPGVFDFTSPAKNVQCLLDAARDAGLWVIARPGPYCNAETNAGGLPLWGSDGSLGKVRTDDATYHKAWQPWIAAIGKIIAKNQIDNGGPVILTQVENELTETRHSASDSLVVYMQQLEAALRAAGITSTPLTSNEKGMRGAASWSSDYQDVGGAVDVYGMDSYPGGMSCTNRQSGFKVVRTYGQWFSTYAPSQPVSLPEFEGGWFSGWGSSTFYDQCAAEHSPEFADVYYKNNIGQRTTFQNIYMTFGGTNWGHSAAPVVYTSYDYSAPLRETRQQTTKLFQTKLVNLFATSSPGLLQTAMVGNGTGFRGSSHDVFSWVLQNPETQATFTVLQQANTASNANVSTSVTLETSQGTFEVPDVALDGRQSKILVTDYPLGSTVSSSARLLYCTADIATSEFFGTTSGSGSSALVLYLKTGRTGEFAFQGDKPLTFTVFGSANVTASTRQPSSSHPTPSHPTSPQAFTYTQGACTAAVLFSNGVLVYLLDQSTAWRFWAPRNGDSRLGSPDTGRIFILGPYLVRSARVDEGAGVLYVLGDSDAATTLEAYPGANTTLHTINWNGKALPATPTDYGSYRASITGGKERIANNAVHLPDLTAGWQAADALPEIQPDYDDGRWTVCNHTTTRSPVAPVTLPVLFASDYGYYAGIKVYRGRFSATAGASLPAAVNITASGGQGFGWVAWLNGHLVGGRPGVAGEAISSAVLSFSGDFLSKSGNDNVLTVLVDYHGHDETSTKNGLANPRGLLGAQLLYGGDNNDNCCDRAALVSTPVSSPSSTHSSSSTGFSSWKIAGNAGGPANSLDPFRGPMNEGGLYAERLGWHLPGAPTSHYPFSTGSSPRDGLPAAGVRFYVTTFALDLPQSLDVPLGIELAAPPGAVARVQLWINGYQYGKYVPHVGPQTRFPLPPGVLNTGVGGRTNNTLALSLWAMTAAGAKLSKVALVGYGDGDDGNSVAAYETVFFTDGKQWNASSIASLQPPWTDRTQYA